MLAFPVLPFHLFLVAMVDFGLWISSWPCSTIAGTFGLDLGLFLESLWMIMLILHSVCPYICLFLLLGVILEVFRLFFNVIPFIWLRFDQLTNTKDEQDFREKSLYDLPTLPPMLTWQAQELPLHLLNLFEDRCTINYVTILCIMLIS